MKVSRVIEKVTHGWMGRGWKRNPGAPHQPLVPPGWSRSTSSSAASTATNTCDLITTVHARADGASIPLAANHTPLTKGPEHRQTTLSQQYPLPIDRINARNKITKGHQRSPYNRYERSRFKSPLAMEVYCRHRATWRCCRCGCPWNPALHR